MDKKIFLTLLFLTAIGLCTGAFFEVFMTGEGKVQLADALTSILHTDAEAIDPLPAFWQTFSGSFLFLLVCFFSPLLFPILPFAVLYLILMGLSMGFSATMLIETMGLEGLYYIFLTLLPSGLLQVFLFSFLLMISIQEGLQVFGALWHRNRARGRKNRNALQLFAGQYMKFYGIGLLLLILICILKVFLLGLAT
ncbi:MAG: hypothetical protein HFE73_11485 [Firmicutes bacterium]|nr:hypothetical protein [Bacillota bacterium]